MLLLLFNRHVHGQTYEWARVIGGPSNNTVFVQDMALDANGNVYKTGYFNGTVDFDPGPGSTILSTNGFPTEIFIQKLDPAGNLVWAKAIRSLSPNSSGGDGAGIIVDNNGFVYVTGRFDEIMDFDPGPGSTQLTSAGLWDLFVLKLNASGDLVWVKSMGGGFNAYGRDIAVDASGNLYITGSYENTVDLDPGPGSSSFTSNGSADIFILKLNAGENLECAKTIGSTDYDYGFSLELDVQGNVYFTGTFGGVADFDPGPGTNNLTAAGRSDAFVCKLNGSGNLVWVKHINGPMEERGYGLAIDGSNNVYTMGDFQNTVDFDPGPGVVNRTNPTMFGSNTFIQKLDQAGNFIWVRDFDYEGEGMALDVAGNVYITGQFTQTQDFDPGPGSFNLSTPGVNDREIFIHSLGPSGDFRWAVELEGAINNIKGVRVEVDANGNVYAAGGFRGTMDFDPGPAVANQTNVGQTNFYTLKLSQCAIPTPAFTTTAANLRLSFTDGSSSTFGTITSWRWDFGDGNTSTLQNPVNNYSVLGTYAVKLVVENDCGKKDSITQSVRVQTTAPPGLSVSFCPGQSIDLASKMRDYTLQVTAWEFFDANPNGGGTKIGQAQAYRGRARAGQRVMVSPSQTTTYYVRTNFRNSSPTISILQLTVSPNCGGGVVPIVALQGGWDAATSSQRTSLQSLGVLPFTEPYSNFGYSFTGGGGETLSPLAQRNTDIVDWVIVELRDSTNPAAIVYSRAPLLLDDGSIVDTDGVSQLTAPVPNDVGYYLAVRHRNHLGLMTAQSVRLGTTIDFSNPHTATYGIGSSRYIANGKAFMYAGDANGDGQVQNTDNIMQWMPQVGTSGYKSGDYNLDGQVQNSDLLQLWRPNTGRGSAIPR
jgi:PKD repeat protein